MIPGPVPTEPRDEAIQAAAKAAYGEVSPYYLSLTRKWMAAAVPHLLDDLTRRIVGLAPYNCELRPDGREDPTTAAWVEGLRDALAVVEKYRNEWAGR